MNSTRSNMASNGLLYPAKTGTCRICQRVRKTDSQVKAVGEVRRGFATGHVWECRDEQDCDEVAKNKIKNKSRKFRIIEIALEKGRFKEWQVFV